MLRRVLATLVAPLALVAYASAASVAPAPLNLSSLTQYALSTALAAEAALARANEKSIAEAASSALAAETTLARANEKAALAAASTSDFLGKFTLATMPIVATTAAGDRIYVSDLGGGGGDLKNVAGCWHRLSTASVPAPVPGAATVPVVARTQSNFVQLTAPGSVLTSVVVNVTGACPGDEFTVLVPNGLLSATGSLGLSVNSSSLLSMTGLGGAYSATIVWTGNAVVKKQGGTVQ